MASPEQLPKADAKSTVHDQTNQESERKKRQQFRHDRAKKAAAARPADEIQTGMGPELEPPRVLSARDPATVGINFARMRTELEGDEQATDTDKRKGKPILQAIRHKVVPPDGPIGPIGDKLSFVPANDPALVPDDQTALKRVATAIERQQGHKRRLKMIFEGRKEREIERDHKEIDEQRARIPAGPDREGKVKNLDELKIARHKKTLEKFHRHLVERTGWRWDALTAEIQRSAPTASIGELHGSKAAGICEIRGPGNGVIYKVYFGESRFNSTPDMGSKHVFTKRGHEAQKGSEAHESKLSKQFVNDTNSVKTRRIVPRAVSVFHLAQMFGVRLTKKDWRDRTAPIEFVPNLLHGKVVEAQLPRFTGPTFGDEYGGHDDVFDLNSAAVVHDLRDPDEVAGGYTWESPLTRPGPKTGLTFQRGRHRSLSRDSPMAGAARQSMQVRNGSGDYQPYLSTASIQNPKKVIRANKGERFDTGAANQATVKIDLSLAKEQGVDVVNQHAEESHKFKTGYDRYYDKDDLAGLQTRIKRGEHLGASQFESWPIEQESNLREGRAVDHTTLPIKRSAQDELDELIYSARKNREVLMDTIPLTCVVEILLNNDQGKWPGLDLFAPLVQGKWMKFTPAIRDRLRSYLTADSGDMYQRMRAMYNKAEEDQKTESGRT